jgi:peptidoglycan hydrolase-like protein with peptidoglycan-binding domain
MRLGIHLLASAALLVQGPALAAGSFNSNHPEEAYPNDMPSLTAGGPYADLMSDVQRKLREQGFDAGPVNGDFTTKTQAALVQFQLSRLLPASGSLDDRTLAELGVKREQREASTQARDERTAAAGGGTQDGGNR